jgi:hypothetical protein
MYPLDPPVSKDVRSIELLDDPPFGDSARARFGAGTANACTPPDAYVENALALEAFALRVGDLLLCGHRPPADAGGDLDRDAEVNGDLEPEKASKPDLLTDGAGSFGLDVNADDSPRTGEKAGNNGDLIVGDRGDEAFPEEKIFCPLTAAKGELGDA